MSAIDALKDTVREEQKVLKDLSAPAPVALACTAARRVLVKRLRKEVSSICIVTVSHKPPQDKQRPEVHTASRFGKGTKRSRATDDETTKEDSQRLVRAKTSSCNVDPSATGPRAAIKTVHTHWKNWRWDLREMHQQALSV